MANPTVLSIGNIITVTISLTPTLLGLPNINTVALLSRETPSWGDAYKIYKEPTTVGTDFGTSTNAFKIASAFFAQQPNPLATNGYLVIIPRTSSGAEDIIDAIQRTVGSVYYAGIIVDEDMSGVPAKFATLTTYIQTLDKMFFYASSTSADYAPAGMLDLLRSNSKTHTRGLFYNDGTAIDTQEMAAAYASRALSVNFAGSLTAATMHMKTLAGVGADQTINETELAKVITAGVDVYGNFQGLSRVFCTGANQFFDLIYNSLAFKSVLQVNGFNFLSASNTKIPQTEEGMNGLKDAYIKSCKQFRKNGVLAPGTWTGNVFGDSEALYRSVLEQGYYVYSSPISLQTSAERSARSAPLVQIAALTAGAIHSSSVTVNVTV